MTKKEIQQNNKSEFDLGNNILYDFTVSMIKSKKINYVINKDNNAGELKKEIYENWLKTKW